MKDLCVCYENSLKFRMKALDNTHFRSINLFIIVWMHVFVSTLANFIIVLYLFDDNENKTFEKLLI